MAETLQQAYARLHEEATRLAGGLTDLRQRAAVYHHIFDASGGNHAFPLIAAHGALWAKGYFEFGMALGRAFSWTMLGRPDARGLQLARLENFANAFRDINRRVCIDVYTNFYFTAEFGDDPEAVRFVAPELLSALNKIHAAQRAERELSDAEKRDVFRAHFLNEQQTIVAPAIEKAADDFNWPLMRFIALRPRIHFAYFPDNLTLQFRNFSRTEERIENGLRAFDSAAAVGWSTVADRLAAYRVLPQEFFAGPSAFFKSLRAELLASRERPVVRMHAV